MHISDDRNNGDPVVYSSLVGRLFASIADAVFCFLLCLGLTMLIEQSFWQYYAVNSPARLPATAKATLNIIMVVSWLLIPTLYFVIGEGSQFQTTIGKKIVGIKVVDQFSCTRIGFSRAFLRNVIKVLSVYFCGIGVLIFIVLFSSEKKRSLHDNAAQSIVIDISS